MYACKMHDHEFMKAIGIADYLLIAADVLDVDAERLSRGADLASLESALNAPFAGWGDQDVYPTLRRRRPSCAPG